MPAGEAINERTNTITAVNTEGTDKNFFLAPNQTVTSRPE